MEETGAPTNIEPPWTFERFAEFADIDIKTAYAAAQRGEIPVVTIGRRKLIPGPWVAANFGRAEVGRR